MDFICSTDDGNNGGRDGSGGRGNVPSTHRVGTEREREQYTER